MRSWISRLVFRSGWLFAIAALGHAQPLEGQAVCGTPGKDGPGGTLTGIVNTYYPGLTAAASAGATTLTLGVGTGASAPIASGDLLLVIQMQDAALNLTNTSNYGAGTGTGSGLIDPRNSGRFEYVTATNSVGLGGGALTFRGTGVGNGLLNSYSDGAPTAALGQRRYQVVRVPQYSSATLGGGLTAGYWGGATGGILAIDVAGQLTLGGTVSVDGRGFRGGAGLGFNGGAGGTNTDFVSLSSNPFHGMKGEGIAGTPRWVLNPATGTNVDLGAEGYPSGDAAQGAPANAGGGGTDGNPAANDQNSGGGGGSNGGAAGQGGFTWSSALDRGGRGGAAYLLSGVNRVILGGGGGAGSRNNSVAPQNAGGAGGGIVMIRAGTVTGSGTISASGLVGRAPANDGAGGGGAGGSVIVLTSSGTLAGLTVQARGGDGGNAWSTQAGAGSAHGPGGGGSGGAVVLSSATTVDVAGGVHGITTTGNLAYGATDGAGGRSLLSTIASSPGTSASPLCVPSLTVTKTALPVTVNNGPAGTTTTYTIVVTNAANRDTARTVALIDTLPTGFTFASAVAPVLAGGASRPSTTNPVAGALIPLFSAFSIPAGGQVTQTFTVNVTSAVPNGVYNNPASANYLDPARTTPTGTTSVAYNIAGTGEDVTVRGPDLTVTKTHVGNFTVGANGAYTVTATNAGTGPSVGNVVVTDTLPAGLGFVSGIGTAWVCGAVGQVVTCTNPTAIAAGANAPAISLTVSVAAAAVPSITNGAGVAGGGEPVGNQGNNSASDPTTVGTALADIAATKTGTASVATGANATYTITVANGGPNPATGIVVTDTLPAGATFVSATGGGTVSAGVVGWPTIASLANGANTTFSVTVTYAAAGSYTDWAASTSTSTDPNLANNNGSAAGARVTTTVTAASANLTVTKTGAATANAGANVTYTIGVSNAGPAPAASVVVTDTLPAGATFVSATGSGTLAAGVVTWPTIASLASGASNSFTVTVTYSAGGSYTNIAAAASPTPDPTLPNRATATTTITPIADLVIAKSGAGSAAIGANVTYTIGATNNGPSSASNVVVTDTLPVGATFVSATGGGTLAASVVTWPAVASIANGGSASFTVTVSYPAAGSYTDLAASTASTTDPTPANNNGSAAGSRVTTVVASSADVAVSNSGPATATAGANVAYTITATNNGPSAASNVVVTDTLPAGATFVSASGGGTLSGNVVTWPAIASLPNGGNTSYTLTVTYPAAGSFTNAAAATTATADPNLANNRAPATTVVGLSADVATTKTGPATVAVGATATYTITTTNNGPTSATNVVVSDTLPVGATFVSATGGGTLSGNVVTWPTIAAIANGGSNAFAVTVTYGVAGSNTNRAASASPTPDPTPANNNGSAPAARVTTIVTAAADLSIVNTGPPTAVAGANVSYTLVATNNGPSAAANVVVTDTLPAGATFVSASGGGVLAANVVTWPAIPSLANSGTASFTLVLSYPAAGGYTNVAAVSSATADPVTANNRDPATTTVGPAADLITTKSGPATVSAGANATYTVTTVNNGPSSAVNVVVTDTLPAGATFVSATGGGTRSGNVVTWPTTASLANGANTVFTVTVTYPAAGTYTNLAASSSPTADSDPTNNDGSAPAARVSTSVDVSSDLAITKTGPASGTAGADLSYTITATNNGPSTATAVVVTDSLPAGATFVSASGGGSAAAGVVTWPAIASLANAGVASFTVTYRLSTGGTAVDVARINAATADPNLADNRATVSTAISASADVVTTKSGPASAVAGQDITYTIVTTNQGPSAANVVVVSDTLPVGLTFISASNGGVAAGNVVTWPTVASLANGANVSYTVVARATSGGTYTNLAASSAATADPNPSNNNGSSPAAQAVTIVAAAADVMTTKTGPATANAGQDISYTITTLNNGPSAATGVVVTDTIPAGLTFVSASNGGTAAGAVVTWPTIASLASSANQSYTLVLRATSGGTYTNVVASTATTADPTPGNNNGSAPGARVATVVTPVADVATTETGPATGTAGVNFSYSLTVTNNGPSAATNVVVVDTLPLGLVFVSATGGGTAASGVVTFPTIASLASGSSATFTVTVVATGPGTFTNLVANSAATLDPVAGNNDGSAAAARVTTVVGASADVVATKTGPATAVAGQNISYSIAVTNQGPSPATAVVATDTLPAGLTFVSASSGGTATANVVTWPTVASLASGANVAFTVVARASNGGTYTNIVASTAATPDPDASNNNGTSPAARVATVVSANADLATTKTGPAASTAGQDLTYTIATTNGGPSPATNVVVTDTLPAGLTFISASNSGTVAGNVVTWPVIGSLAASGSQIFTLVARAAAGGSYLNIAASTSATPDANASNNDGSLPAARVTTVIAAAADVATTKTGPATANAGQAISYTITTLNNGPSPASGVVVTDSIPAGLTFVSASNGGTAAGAVVTWPTIVSLASSANQSYTLVLRAANGGTYTNVVASTATTADPTPGNNDGSAPAARVATVVTPVADVATTETGPATGTAGVNFSYTLTVTNNGPSTATNVVVVDTLPLGLVFVTATGGGTAASGVVTFPTILSLASGSSVTFTVTVVATGPGTFTNLVANSAATLDPVAGNNDGSAAAARVTTVVGASADVVATKAGPATAVAGQDITYTIGVTNQGPSPATAVVVTDTLPTGLTLVSASNGGTATGNVVTWPTVASLASGANVAFTVVARASNGGSYTDIVASTAATPDPDASNNNGTSPAARVATVVSASADLATTKTGPATATAGQNLSYTVTVTNNGPSAAASVVVTDTLPAGLTFVSATSGGVAAGNVVTWPTITTLASGASQVFSVTANAGAAGTYTDIVASTSTTPDPVAANNDGSAPASRVTTVVAASADVFTTKSGPATGLVGQDLVYTVSVTNAGPSAAANVVLTDTLPAGTVFQSATGGATFAAGVVTWPSIGSLGNGVTTSFTVTLRATGSGTFVNLLASSASTADPNAGNNNGSSPTSQVATIVGPTADLVTTKSGPAAVTAGQNITYSITTTNNGPSAAATVAITDTLPAGITFVTASNGGVATGNVVNWPIIGSLANGASVTYSVLVRAANGGSYLDIAASGSSTPDLTAGNNNGSAPTARVTTVVTGSADLVTTKTGPSNATAGQDVTYTLITLNNGPSAAQNVAVTDTLATGAVFVSASNGGTLSGNVVSWPSVASLPSGGSLSYAVTVHYNNAGGYLDIAASSSTTADPVASNNDGSAPNAQVITVIGASADLLTTKSGPATATAGSDVVYTITTTNSGPSDAAGVVVSDTLPAGATFISASNGATVSGGVVLWPVVATLPSGGILTYSVTLRFNASGGYLNLAASTSATPDPFPTNNDGSPPAGRVNTVVGPSADVVTTKTGPATAVAGQDIGYSISVTNNGPTPATNVVVADTLPAGFTFVSATGSGTLSGNVISWPTIVSMANGANSTFDVVVRAAMSGAFLNLAASTATSPDPDLSNNDGSLPAARVTTIVGVSADVVTTKTGPAQAAIGQDFSYTISAVNNGPSLAADVVVTDTLPAGLTVISVTGGGAVSGTIITWPTITSLAVAAPVSFTVVVRASAPGSYTNVAASTSATPDPTPSNNGGSAVTSRVTTDVSNNANLAVTKTGPATANASQDISYAVTIMNDGPAAATNVVVTDTLPAGVTLVFASSGATASGNVVTWPSLSSLAAGATASYTVIVRSADPGSYTDIAAVTATSTDPSLADNRATATTVVLAAGASADVATTKTGPAAITGGGTIVYTIQTINNGPSVAVNVVVTDTLPANATFVSATGGATKSGNILVWPTIPALANGASVIFTVTLIAPATGSVLNIAASGSSTPDPILSNNNGSATNSRTITAVNLSADLVTTKTGPANAAAGGQLSYHVLTRNEGPDLATNVLITDSLPAGALFVSASDGGVFAGGVVTWTVIPSLASGASATRTVTLIAPGNVAVITNVARSTSATPDPNPGNNRGIATTTLSSSADVLTTKSGPAKADAGGTISYLIKAKNLGPNSAAAVSVIDSLPAGVTFVSATGGGVLVGPTVVWPTLPVIAAGDSVVFTLVVTAPNATATLTNVVASTALTPDPNPENNDGSKPDGRVITEVAPVDLAIAKTHTGDLVPGAIALYQLTVTNVGPAPTRDPIVVRDTLPVGLSFQSATGSGWSCVNAGPIVTCRYDAVPFPLGGSTAITLRVLVAKTAPTTITNRAHVSTPGDTDDTGNNVSSDQAATATGNPISIEKVASRTDAEIADVVDYTVLIRNRTTAEIPALTVTDVLPKGFTYQRKTARTDLIPIADPAGAPGPTLSFAVGDLAPNGAIKLTYRVRIGAGATLGDGANQARATSATGIESGVALAVVRVRGGVFTDRGIIVGKVFLHCDCDSTVHTPGRRAVERDTVGVPGVRIFLEDGSSVVTDLEGKYNFVGIVSGLHVLRVDPTTVPRGGQLILLDSRSAGDPTSRFVDLKNGELHKADFAIQYADSVSGTIDLRRARGEVLSAIVDTIAGTDTNTVVGQGGRSAELAERDRPIVGVDAGSDTARVNAYRPLAAETSANPIEETNRLPITRLPGTAAPLTAVPNGSVQLTPARRSLPADGNTAMAVRVKILDQDRTPITSDQPITLETSLGRWLVPDLDPVEPGIQTTLQGGQADYTLVASSEAGVGEIRVTNGLRVSTTQMVFLPASRPLFVNGVVEARIDLRSLLRNGLLQVTSADRFERELKDLRAISTDGKFSAAARGALFLQGKIKGSTLLTLAYDTERDPERRMFRDIQPDEFYPVYGDASIKEFGTQSFDRLYLRVDAERSYALYGDYVTPAAGTGALAARELGAYQRSLTGALAHGEDRRGQFNVFASRDRLSQVVEEIPGRGISGPYELRRTDGRLNSEKVEILTRDRNQPSRIISSVPLTRFTDYTLEPFSGRLLFFAPVPSVDGDLNPVSIRVVYEVERSGEDFWVYGADGQLRIGDRFEFGAGAARDDQPGSSRQLYSTNAAVVLGKGTVLVTEFAHTSGDSANFKGDAARFELRHSSAKLQASVFGATSDAGFSNLSSTFQRGRTELGLRGSAVINERTRFIGEALRTGDRIAGGYRTGVLAGIERQFGKFVRGEFGYRFGQERGGAASRGTAGTPGATPNETNALRARVTVQVPGQPRASVFGEFEQDVANGDQHRGALGGQYVLFDRLRIYGRHEFLNSFAGPFALNGAQRQATTVIGLDAGYTKDGQFFGEYRASDAFAGRETEAAIGLRNRWSVAKGLVVNTGFERVDVLKGTGQGEATAITAGAEYTTNPAWRGTARFEYRFAHAGDDFLATLGYVRKIDRDWTVLGRALYNTFGDGGKRTRNQIGFAWRETDRNRWNGLARWENRLEQVRPDSPTGSVERSNILSAHLNYQPTAGIWLSGRFAGKWAKDKSAGLETSSKATLVSIRALYDFLPRWDAGLIGSTMWSGGKQYGVGLELGRTVIKNMRAAIGYNVFGFRDQGLVSDGAQTDHGLYLHFGFKFSEEAFKRLAGESRQP